MNLRLSSKIISLFIILGLLFSSGLSYLPARAQDNGAVESKVSTSLDYRVKMKARYLAQDIKSAQAETPAVAADNPLPGVLTDSSIEKIFIRLAQRPSADQLSELQTMGLTVYPNSWIPPAGHSPTGSILADMPLDKLSALAGKSYVVSLDTAEMSCKPQNDLARAAMNVDPVLQLGDNGTGVTIAVLDSGLDLTNADIPTPVASKDYSNYPTLGDNITNNVTGHGTHTTASAVGRGVLNPAYKGTAPGANLVFLRVGDNVTGSATDAAISGAVRDAVDIYHANIITMSYGGWSTYHDGSDVMCNAVDYATSQGATVFMAAGNESDKGWHYSGTVPAHSATGFIQINAAVITYLGMYLVWFDGLGTHNPLQIWYYNSSQTQLTDNITMGSQSESSRGTEAIASYFNNLQPAGTYYLKVVNTSGNSQFFHIYYVGGNTNVVFNNPDPLYTINSPAEADTALAVGAYVTRTSWTNYQGNTYSVAGESLNSIASYSSHGPRVDPSAPGKPNIVAPGSVVISARDSLYTLGGPYAQDIIKTSGPNNGSPPADYLVMEGTSMSTALAAGVGALILAKHPTLTPAQVRQALQGNAVDKGTAGFDNIYGWGLVNAAAAVAWTPPARHIIGDYNGDGKADYSVWRPNGGNWFVYPNFTPTQFGLNGDVIVPGDYNNDGITERAVWRPSEGNWFVYPNFTPAQFGLSGDIPVPAEYNGDNTTEFAVWRPHGGNWFVYPSLTPTQFGLSADIPVPADYNGDGKAEFAVWRPSTGNWYVYPNLTPTQFGLTGDIPVPADYTGVGHAQFAVWRPSTGNWYVYPDFTHPTQFGLPGDIPVPADYNGVGQAQYAVWRPSNGMWYVYPDFAHPVQFGLHNDVPGTILSSVRYLKFGH
jgi:subtilisin family serine protease